MRSGVETRTLRQLRRTLRAEENNIAVWLSPNSLPDGAIPPCRVVARIVTRRRAPAAADARALAVGVPLAGPGPLLRHRPLHAVSGRVRRSNRRFAADHLD